MTNNTSHAAHQITSNRSSLAASLIAPWLISVMASLLTVTLLWFSFHPAATDAHLYDKLIFAWAWLAALFMCGLPMLVIVHLLMARGQTRTAWTLLIVAQWLLCAFAIADMSIYRITSNHLSTYFMFIFQPQLLTIGGGAALILRRVAELLCLAAVITLICLFLGRFLASLLMHRRPAGRLVYVAPAVYILFIASLAIAQRFVRSYPKLYTFVQSLPFNLAEFDLGPVPPDSTAFSSALSSTMNGAIVQWVRQADVPPTPGPSVRITRPNPPNVVILVIDSLRRDMFDPQYMPQLYARAQQGMVFLNHKPGVNGTPWAMYDITYGQYSMFLRRTIERGIKPALPAIFNRSGYHTLYLEGHDDSNFYDMWKYVGPGSGFDQTIIRSHGNQWDAADKDILQYISADLAHASQPQMVLTLLSAVHYPYYYPPSFNKLTPVMDTFSKSFTDMNPKTDRTPLFNRYKNAVAYEDHLIGDFLNRIDLKHTVVLILGDHGESFWEDGHLSHAGPMSRIVMSVPCFWIGAGVPNRRIQMITQHVDLLPTLLHIVQGTPQHLAHEDGMDMLNNPSPRAVWLACPPFGDDAGMTFIVNRPDKGIELYWSNRKHRLLYNGEVTLAGQLLPYTIPTVAHAAYWGARLDPLIARLMR